MAGVIDSLSSLLSSILSTVQGIFSSIFHLFGAALATVQNFVSSVVAMAGGLVNFLLSNIVIIGVLVAAYVGYTAYAQKRQPGGITKKRS